MLLILGGEKVTAIELLLQDGQSKFWDYFGSIAIDRCRTTLLTTDNVHLRMQKVDSSLYPPKHFKGYTGMFGSIYLHVSIISALVTAEAARS